MTLLTGNIIDIEQSRIYHGEIRIADGRIASVRETDGHSSTYLMPGFIDAHVHVESSMLVPAEFARLAVVHGTVGSVSDPHEIANVLGMRGVEFMLENARQVPFKFCFGAPSCVPATDFETAGARLDVAEVETLLRRSDIGYLSEMMNYPGVLHGDPDVMAKIALAQKIGKPVDGHAPGLTGEEAARYIAAGISTDHECFTEAEAVHKLSLGMKILIREGSAAKNFAALIGLLPQYSDRMMFCSDDKHPDDLIRGHINELAARAVAAGCDLFDVLRAACLNPADHYQLPVGRMRDGDPADLIRIENTRNFRVTETYIDGVLVAKDGKSLLASAPVEPINHFAAAARQPADFRLPRTGKKVRVIRALDGEIVTKSVERELVANGDLVETDPGSDLLKIAVINRYEAAPPAVALVEGFGLQRGALASCVAHDSHNIIAVGTSDEDLARAVNLIVSAEGGISAVGPDRELVLPLPVAGIMSAADGYTVARAYSELDTYARKTLASTLQAPFMTLSFMALLVIPDLKLSDRGLFDGRRFCFTSLFPDA